MSFYISTVSKRSVLKVNSANGCLESFFFDGEELLREAKALFTIALRNAAGDMRLVSANDFASFVIDCDENGGIFTFTGLSDAADFVCKVRVRSADEKFFWSFDIVNPLEDEWALEWVDGPQIVVSGKLADTENGEGYLFHSLNEGMLISDPRRRYDQEWFRYKYMGFPNTGSNGYYPGGAQMQMLAYFNDKAGLYFAAHDTTHCTKAVEWEYLPETESIRLSLQTFCGMVDPGHYVSPFEYVLAGFHGDWYAAAELYREWAETDPGLPAKLINNARMPEWFLNSPVTLFIPVRGDGDDKGDMSGNEYFPYINIMPHAERLAEEFDSKVMVLLMHWEGTAPWAPPYVWPPFGGVEPLAELRDALHAKGHNLGVYCSGTAWTQTSSIIDYSREEECDRDNLRAEMSCGPDGDITGFICNGPKGVGQRLGFDSCIDREWTQNTVYNEIMKLADFGVDYTQYFDQNLGGSAHLCYSPVHGHPHMPGVWQTEAMKRLCSRVEDTLAARNNKMLIGCEAAAAQPYLKYMQFSDLRNVNAFWTGGKPVPAYSYIFHEYINNFMGNQNGLTWCIDMPNSPENLLFRTAYSFNSGDMLGAILKDHGDIHWCWVMKWHEDAPDQDSIKKLIRNLNYWRTHEGFDFLVYGKMLAPVIDIENGKFGIPSQIAKGNIYVDDVLTSSWRSQDGRTALFITNYHMTERDVNVNIPEGKKVSVRDMAGNVRNLEGSVVLHLDPVSALMLEID